MPRGDIASTNEARNSLADATRRHCADLNLAVRGLQACVADPLYRAKYLTDPARKDLADARDRITDLLGDHHG